MKGRRLIILFLLLPGAVFLLFFTALPLYFMVERSFYRSNYIVNKWVGLQNYIKSFFDKEYRQVFGSSFLYTAIICPTTVFVPLFFALLVYDTPKWVQTYTKFVFFIPSFASGVIIASVWRWIYHPRIGLLNYLTSFIGMKPVTWMANRYTGIAGMSVMTISGIMGVPLLIYLSSILSIPAEVFDAARVDGASRIQVKLRIVLPLLGPSILLVVLITMMSGFFIIETILMMTNGGYGTQTFMFNIFYEGVDKQRVGMAAARSALLFVIVMAMAVVKRKLEGLKR